MMFIRTINTIEDFKDAINNRFDKSGAFLCDETQVFEVPEDLNEVQCLIDSYEGEKDALYYQINFDDDELYTEGGVKIPKVEFIPKG